MKLIKTDNPILRSPTQFVMNRVVIKEKIDEMFEIMNEYGGIGLAAPQVGWDASVFIMNRNEDFYGMEFPRIVINPQILAKEGPKIPGKEGCLSLFGLTFTVYRYFKIKVRYKTITSSDYIYETLKGFPARVFLHEYDHLFGIMIDQIGEQI